MKVEREEEENPECRRGFDLADLGRSDAAPVHRVMAAERRVAAAVHRVADGLWGYGTSVVGTVYGGESGI